MTNSNNPSISAGDGSFINTGSVSNSVVNLGEISGSVSNAINELPPDSTSDQPSLKDLLSQLQAALEADENLSETDKKDALEQVGVLAEAGKNPKENAMQQAAKQAVTMLKGLAFGLPATAKAVEAAKALLPMIQGWFGF
jgi:hypothetical protein